MGYNLKDIEYFFKSFDFFGESFTFKIQKRKYYTSLMGGCMSFGFIIYTIYYLIYNLSDFLRKNIRTSENEIKIANENMVYLNDHSYLTFYICLRDSKMILDDNLQNLEIESSLIHDQFAKSQYSSNEMKLNLNSCTSNEFTNLFQGTYNYTDYSKCKCLNMSKQQNIIDNKNFFLKTKNYAEKSYLRFKINTNNNKYLIDDNSKLYFHFPSFYVNPKDLIQPIKNNTNTEIFSLKQQNQIQSKIDLTLMNFHDYYSLYDDGKIINYSIIKLIQIIF